MSVKLMSIVFEMPVPHVQKLVLLALADRANDAGTECYYAVSTIMRRTSLGERTVRKAIGDLAKAGHLSVYERQGHSSNYVLHLTTPIVQPEPPKEPEPLHGVHPPKETTDQQEESTPARGAPPEPVDKPVDGEPAPLHGVHPPLHGVHPHPCTACTPTPARHAPNPSTDPKEDTRVILKTPPTPQGGAGASHAKTDRTPRDHRQRSAAAWAKACEVIDGIRGRRGKTWDDAREPLGDARIEVAIEAAGGYRVIAERTKFTQSDLKRRFRERFEQLLATSNNNGDLRSIADKATKVMR